MTETDAFKLKIIELKDRLPKNYHPLICEKHPELDNQQSYDRIRNVVNLKQVDEEVYRLLVEVSQGTTGGTPGGTPKHKAPENKTSKIDELFKEV